MLSCLSLQFSFSWHHPFPFTQFNLQPLFSTHIFYSAASLAPLHQTPSLAMESVSLLFLQFISLLSSTLCYDVALSLSFSISLSKLFSASSSSIAYRSLSIKWTFFQINFSSLSNALPRDYFYLSLSFILMFIIIVYFRLILRKWIIIIIIIIILITIIKF